MTLQPGCMTGRLYLCATPIGNLGDASPRLAETLAAVDLVYAEDTRRSAKLLAALGVSTPLRSYFVGNQSQRAGELEVALTDGRAVALITDAGSPAVSDPGASAVAVARRADARVIVVPGPSAVTAAVMGSGLVDGAFVFEGFLARKGRERQDQLTSLRSEHRPVVLFLTPHRIGKDLADLVDSLGGDREVCVARELTKLHEELWWGTLDEAQRHWQEEVVRGEFTVVVAGSVPSRPTIDEALDLAHELMGRGVSPSRAAREAAEATGIARRDLYERLIT